LPILKCSSTSQAEEAPLLANYAVNSLGLKRLAMLHLNTDWGRTSKDLFVKAAQDRALHPGPGSAVGDLYTHYLFLLKLLTKHIVELIRCKKPPWLSLSPRNYYLYSLNAE
jgi:hypothetical protein